MCDDYDYMEVMKDDIREYIAENIDAKDFSDRDELEEHLNDELFVDDSVTGIASGSYTFNSYDAAENIAHNWELLKEALDEFGCDENPIEKGEEWCDVTIRCYLLGNAISEVLDDMESELFPENEEE